VSRPAEWQTVLNAEVVRWSRMTCKELIGELSKTCAYRIQLGSKEYQVEIELVEDTKDYVHVIISVDDGTLPRSILPLTHGFIKQKDDDGGTNSDRDYRI
jgi:hypothetical protein